MADPPADPQEEDRCGADRIHQHGPVCGPTRQIPFLLFEHDVYFQSIARGLRTARFSLGWMKAFLEYMRALRYELRLLPGWTESRPALWRTRSTCLVFLPQLRDRLTTTFAPASTRSATSSLPAGESRYPAVPRQFPPPPQPRGLELVPAERASAGARRGAVGPAHRDRLRPAAGTHSSQLRD